MANAKQASTGSGLSEIDCIDDVQQRIDQARAIADLAETLDRTGDVGGLKPYSLSRAFSAIGGHLDAIERLLCRREPAGGRGGHVRATN